MNKTEQATLEIRQALFELIGEVTAKTLFASYGIFSENAMFGIYQNGILYVRAEDELADYLISLGAVNYIPNTPSFKLTISNYFLLPQEVISDKDKYKKILQRSIQQIKEQKSNESLHKYRRIKDLPNLSMKYERLLYKVGIEDLALFRTLGAANTYARLVKKGISTEMNIFWCLTAALQNKHVSLLTKQEKENALKILSIVFENNGLKLIKQ